MSSSVPSSRNALPHRFQSQFRGRNHLKLSMNSQKLNAPEAWQAPTGSSILQPVLTGEASDRSKQKSPLKDAIKETIKETSNSLNLEEDISNLK